MNSLLPYILIIFCFAWLGYILGLRDKRIAFTLWFPFAATSLLGTIFWLFVLFKVLTNREQGGGGWAVAFMGSILLFAFLIFPVVLGVSIWKRPKAEAYSMTKMLPVVMMYIILVCLYRQLSSPIEFKKSRVIERQIELTVLDTDMKPVTDAAVKYDTKLKTGGLAIPTTPFTGEVKTGNDGSVYLKMPENYSSIVDITKEGYANLSVHVDRCWTDTWHTIIVDWEFPPATWRHKRGYVETGVYDTDLMHLTVYLPKTDTDKIPNYGQRRVYHLDQGKQSWTMEPARFLMQK